MTYNKGDKIMLKRGESVLYGTLGEEMRYNHLLLRIEDSVYSNTLDPREWTITMIEPAQDPFPTTPGSIIETRYQNQYVLTAEGNWLCIKGTGSFPGTRYTADLLVQPIKVLYIHD